MFLYSEISRWLTFTIDPISVQDWVANRDLFGPVENPSENDKELEAAYQIESIRQKKITATKDLPLEILLSGMELSGSQKVKDDIWLLAPVGSIKSTEKKAVELEISSGTTKDKIIISPFEVKAIPLTTSQKYHVKANLKGDLRVEKKSGLEFDVEGCKKIIIDTRGRPMMFVDLKLAKQKLIEWKGALSES